MALSPAQVELRRGCVGSSMIGAILGVHPSKTPHDAYAEIIGASTFEGNEATEIGNELETPIARLYARQTLPERFLVRGFSVRRGWMVATPDFGVVGPEDWHVGDVPGPVGELTGAETVEAWTRAVARNVEIKAVGEWRIDGWNTDVEEGIPDYVRVQVEWQMELTGVHTTDVVALLGGTKLHVWTIRRNDRLAAGILARVTNWHRRHIVEGIPPDPDGSEAAKQVLAKMWPRERAPLRDAELGEDFLAQQVLAAKAATKRAKTEEARLCQLLQQRIGDAEGIRGGDWKATWKFQEGGVVPTHTRKGTRVLRVTGSIHDDDTNDITEELHP